MFKITVAPTDIPDEFDVQVAGVTVSRIMSLRPLKELQLDYQLPAVWLRYYNTELPDDHMQVRDTDLEIIQAIKVLATGMAML
jgi:hypothetical protein